MIEFEKGFGQPVDGRERARIPRTGGCSPGLFRVPGVALNPSRFAVPSSAWAPPPTVWPLP